MKKLAIYYGWPSLVRGSNKESPSLLDDAINRFLHFDLILLGAGLESPDHLDYFKTQKIIETLHEHHKETFGYTHLALSDQFPSYSDIELIEKLNGWKEMRMKGIFIDLLHPVYNASVARIERIVNAAHNLNLGIMYNTCFDSIPEKWLKKRIIPFAEAGDSILIEPFGTSWQRDSYPIPKKLPKELRKLKAKGITLASVSTYDSKVINTSTHPNIEILTRRYSYYKDMAEALGFDAYQLTNGEYSAYGNDQNVLIDFH